MWIWLIIAILVGGLAAFIMFVGVALESGFRSKVPLDFLAHTRWGNRYYEDRGDKLKVVIRLNAPIVTHSPFTITVIVSGEQEKEWNFSVEKDEKILEMFDVYFSYYYNKGA